MAMLSPQSDPIAEQEMLSAYIDNQLSGTERVALERRLQSDERLRAELNELRAVKTALRDLPSIVPPRSFTLDPASVRGPVRLPLFQWLRLGSALATMLLVLTFTLDFVAVSRNSASAPQAAFQATTAPAAGGSLAGGAAASEPAAANGATPFIASDEQQPTMAAAAAPAATSAPAAAAQAASEPTAPLETGPMAAAAAPTVPPEVVPPASVHASDNSSPDTNSSALPSAKQQARTQNAPTNAPFRWLQLVLGIVAVGLAFGAWAVRRRERI